MATRMLQRRGTTAEWTAQNPVLANGEIGYDEDTKIIKMGDGVTPWNSLDSAHLNKSGGTMTGPLNLIVPTSASHAVRKDYVDDANQAEAITRAAADTAINDDLQGHKGTTNPHDATVTPTASRLVLRDSNGRTKFAAPSVDADAATKGYVDEEDAKAIPKSLVNAEGDILVGVGANSLTRLAKGNNNTFLGVADNQLGYFPAGGGSNPLNFPHNQFLDANVSFMHIISGATYIVPTGKILYVVHYESNNSAGSVRIINPTSGTNSVLATGNDDSAQDFDKRRLNSPIIVPSGFELVTNSNDSMVIGYLVDDISDVNVIFENTTSTLSYTVPTNKAFILLGVLNTNSSNRLNIDGQYFYGSQDWSFNYYWTFKQPLIFTENMVLSSQSNSGHIGFNGYEVNL